MAFPYPKLSSKFSCSQRWLFKQAHILRIFLAEGIHNRRLPSTLKDVSALQLTKEHLPQLLPSDSTIQLPYKRRLVYLFNHISKILIQYRRCIFTQQERLFLLHRIEGARMLDARHAWFIALGKSFSKNSRSKYWLYSQANLLVGRCWLNEMQVFAVKLNSRVIFLEKLKTRLRGVIVLWLWKPK